MIKFAILKSFLAVIEIKTRRPVSREMTLINRWKTGISRRALVGLACLLIILVALTVRSFHWQDNPISPFHGMTGEYKAHAMVLVQGDFKTFLRGPNPPSNANVI